MVASGCTGARLMLNRPGTHQDTNQRYSAPKPHRLLQLLPLSELKELVNAAGFWPSPYILSRIKEVLTTDDDTNLIYFDDFIEAISLVRDERVESMMLACMEHPRKRAQRYGRVKLSF